MSSKTALRAWRPLRQHPLNRTDDVGRGCPHWQKLSYALGVREKLRPRHKQHFDAGAFDPRHSRKRHAVGLAGPESDPGDQDFDPL
jgi:hypothetical protein